MFQEHLEIISWLILRDKITNLYDKPAQIDFNEICMAHKILEDARSLFSSRNFITMLSWLIMDIIVIFDIIATFIFYNFQFSEEHYLMISYLCLPVISIT